MFDSHSSNPFAARNTRRRVRRAQRALLEAIAWCLPAGCLVCEALLPAVAPLSVCDRCRSALDRKRPETCATCSREMTTGGQHVCEECRREPPAFDRLSALWRYDDRSRPIVHGLKFGGLRYLGSHIAKALHDRFGEEIRQAGLIVAIPLHPWRTWTRGFNQAAEIARPLSLISGVPYAPLLRRRRATPPQRGLDRSSRRTNLAEAFCVRRRAANGIPRRVLLVDDVVTTGATLDAAARALKHAGVEHVHALTAAQTSFRRLD